MFSWLFHFQNVNESSRTKRKKTKKCNNKGTVSFCRCHCRRCLHLTFVTKRSHTFIPNRPPYPLKTNKYQREHVFYFEIHTHTHEKRTLIKMVSLQRQKIHWARFVLFSVLSKQHTHYLLIFIKMANNKGIFLPKRCMRLLFSRADIFVGMVRWRQKIRIINIQMDTYMQNIN